MRAKRTRPAGSNTNASDAVDDINLSSQPTPDEVLDAGVEHTFPASDPIAIDHAYKTACDREKAREATQARHKV